MAPETSTTSDQPSERYPQLAEKLPRELHVYQLGGEEIFVRDCEHGVECYKHAGETESPEEIAAHDGPALVNGYFWYVENDDGVIQAYHPHTGKGPRLGDELSDVEATLLAEVEKVV